MKDLKIRVATEAESKEAQGLLDALGYSKGPFENKSTPCWIAICDGLTYSDYDIGKSIWYTACPEEITLQELRDMVNPMKEYLVKKINGDYVVTDHHSGFDVSKLIEIPEGADVTFKRKYGDGLCFFQCVGENGADWCSETKKWISRIHPVDDWYFKNSPWQRHTQPEELPFIDDEPKYTDDEVKYMDENGQGRWQSINDQYAEIEQVRKHRHYFKDVSNIAEIDVYAVLKLFDVTDPCLQHIVKKALCAGKRGHKDMMEDLQNIVDTAIRAVELNS